MVYGLILCTGLFVLWFPCLKRGCWATPGPVYARDRRNRAFRITPTGNCCENKCT